MFKTFYDQLKQSHIVLEKGMIVDATDKQAQATPHSKKDKDADFTTKRCKHSTVFDQLFDLTEEAVFADKGYANKQTSQKLESLGIGGVSKGRIIEIYGPESSGKTTLCLHIIAEAQKLGGLAAFIDAEHALDVNYAKRLGVDSMNLLISQPDFGEQALEIADTLVRSNAIDVIIIDSVAALVPRAEIEGDMGDAHMAQQARLMSQALRKLTGAISRSKTCVIFTNQLRSKIGVMFGSPETTTGGNALKFYASVRLDIRRIGAIKEGTDVIGNRTKVKIVKSKVAPPFKEIEFDILYNEGISKTGDVLDLAVLHNIVKKGGSWFTFGEDRFQGREQLKAKMIEYPEMYTKMLNEVKEKLGMVTVDTTERAKGTAESKTEAKAAAKEKKGNK